MLELLRISRNLRSLPLIMLTPLKGKTTFLIVRFIWETMVLSANVLFVPMRVQSNMSCQEFLMCTHSWCLVPKEQSKHTIHWITNQNCSIKGYSNLGKIVLMPNFSWINLMSLLYLNTKRTSKILIKSLGAQASK